MTQSQPIRETIQQRFYHLLIGLAEAKDVAGGEFNDALNADETEQGNARRQLLRMEKLAMRDKELNRRSEENLLSRMNQLVHDTLSQRMQQELHDIDNVVTKVIGLDMTLAPLLDMLSTRAASISKLEPLVVAVSWLPSELLKLVNTPKYRRTDAKGKVVVVENLRMALGFFGLENLKLIIPSMAFRRLIPQITDPFPSIKLRLWQQALGNGITTLKLAELAEMERGQAFTLGMLHEVGKVAVIRLYFRMFDAVLREALQEAQEGLQKEEYAALGKVQPSATFLTSFMREYSLGISARVIEHLGFKRLFISPAMQEFAEDTPLKEMSPLGRCLAQANAYTKYRMLKGFKLINMDEAKAYLTLWHMPKGSLAILKTTDLRTIDMQFVEDEDE